MKTKSPKLIHRAVLLICLCLSIQSVSAQAPASPKRFEIFMQVRQGDTTMVQTQMFTSNSGSSYLFKENTQLAGVAHIILNGDATDISYIHIKIGSTSGGNDIFEKTFENVQGIFDDGTFLSKRGNTWIIGLGNFVGLNSYYAEVYLENSTADTSPVVSYVKQ